MVDTAGTLCQAANAIAKKGALQIVAICTHAVLSGEALQKIEDSAISKLYVSDSINLECKTLPRKIKVLTSANLFGEAIMRISGEKSISSLFNDFAD